MYALLGRLLVAIVLAALIAFVLLLHYRLDGVNRKYHPGPFYSLSGADLNGKVVIITGGNTGLGKGSAALLVRHAVASKAPSFTVVITSRSLEKAKAAAADIAEEEGAGENIKIIGMELDLGDHESVFAFAQGFRALDLPLHVLMLNAGMGLSNYTLNKDGFEATTGSNWLGHFYLQQLLQDIVEKSAPSRIVILSSPVHYASGPTRSTRDSVADSEMNRAHFSSASHYGLSKLFNIHHGLELHRRLRERGINDVYVLMVNPGVVTTDLARDLKNGPQPTGLVKLIVDFVSQFNVRMDAETGALTQLYASFSPDIEVKDLSGKYVIPLGRVIENPNDYYLMLSKDAMDPVFAKQTWEEGLGYIKDWPKF